MTAVIINTLTNAHFSWPLPHLPQHLASSLALRFSSKLAFLSLGWPTFRDSLSEAVTVSLLPLVSGVYLGDGRELAQTEALAIACIRIPLKPPQPSVILVSVNFRQMPQEKTPWLPSFDHHKLYRKMCDQIASTSPRRSIRLSGN